MSTALALLALAPLTLAQSRPSSAQSHAAAAPTRTANGTGVHAAPQPRLQPNGGNGSSHGAQPSGGQVHSAQPVASSSSASTGPAHPSAPVSDGKGSRHHDGCGPRAPAAPPAQTEIVENGVVVVYGPTDEAGGEVAITDGTPPDAMPPPDDGSGEISIAPQDPDASQAMTIDDGSGESPTIYRWVDDEGGVHYSSGELVPESARATATPTNGEPILVTHPEQN